MSNNVAALVTQYESASQGGDTPAWRKLHAMGQRPVRLIFWISEIVNPDVAGFLWAFEICGKLKKYAEAVDPALKLAAQGIGPAYAVNCDLNTAIAFASQASSQMCAIQMLREEAK